MKKLSLLFSLFLMVSVAAGFTANLEPVKRSASPDDPAIFSLTVENNGTTSSRFLLDYNFPESGWMYSERSKTIPAGETGIFNISINPDEDSLQRSYSFSTYVTEFETGDSLEFSDYMSVKRDYRLNVVDFNVEKTDYMPGEVIESSITVQNLAPRIISGYSFDSSMDGEVESRDGEPIAPRASKTYSFKHQLPEEASPGNRNVSIKLVFEGEERTFSETVEVAEIRKINRSKSVDDRGIEKNGEINVENLGNSKVNLTENITLPSYVEPVLSLSPEPDRKIEKEDQTVYIWDFALGPGEKASFQYSVAYWMPLSIVFTILAGVLVLRRLSGSMKIKKKVENQGEDLKISLEVKNSTERARDKITIEDFVPNVAKLDEDFEMTEPNIKRTVDGTNLEWELEDFRPGEKRVIQYRITPKVEVEGGIDLPEAKIHSKDSLIAESDRKK